MTRFRRIFTVFVFAALVLLLATPAWPTAQIPERIVYEGTEGFLFTEPAGELFHQGKPPPGIRLAPYGMLAGIRRCMGDQGEHPLPLGYQGLDERRGGKGRPRRVREGLSRKVKTHESRVVHGNPAHPQGKPIRYVHMGYQTIYEVRCVPAYRGGKGRRPADGRQSGTRCTPIPRRRP